MMTTNTSDLHHDHDHGSGGGHHMPMSFYFSTHGTILFEGWQFHSAGALVGSMCALFVLSFGYEALKFLRTCHLAKALKETKVKGHAELPLLSLAHTIQTGLHGIQATLGYFLMLVFMTYNAWLCIVIILGFTCGYFAFAWKNPTLADGNNEHCS